MKSNKLPLLLFLALSLFMSSCSIRLVDFTIISSKNHSIDFDKSQGVRVEGSSNGLFGMGASIKDAMDKALESAGPQYDILVDGVVRVNDYVFVSGFKVEGTALSSQKLRVQLGPVGFESWCMANNVFDPEIVEVKN